LQSAGSAKRETGELEQTPEAVESWVAHLYQRFAQRPIAVAVEQSRGALVFMLSKYEPLHLFPVPPQMASSMRQALYPSGAKDDPRDADLLLDILLQHRNRLRSLSPDSEATRRVQNLVEERRKLVDEKTAQINRLTDHLKAYFPQMLEWFGRLDSDVVCALLERWPALEELQKAQPASLRAFLRKHRCRDREQIEHRMEAVRQAIPAIHDRAVIEAKSAAVRVIVRVVRILGEGIEDLDGEIEEAAAAHPDFFIFNSLPGAGPVMAPRLLAAFGSQRERYGSADELQSFSGIAPLTEASGKRSGYIFVGPVRSFYGKAFTNGRVIRSPNRSGRARTTSNNAVKAIPTMRPCGPWLSNGSALYFVVGRTELLMMKMLTWPRSLSAAPHWPLSSLREKRCENFVDTR
jgi:transposase